MLESCSQCYSQPPNRIGLYYSAQQNKLFVYWKVSVGVLWVDLNTKFSSCWLAHVRWIQLMVISSKFPFSPFRTAENESHTAGLGTQHTGERLLLSAQSKHAHAKYNYINREPVLKEWFLKSTVHQNIMCCFSNKYIR